MENINLNEINNFWQFLIAFFSFSIPFFLKWISDNKKRKKLDNNLSAIDKKQSEQIRLLILQIKKFDDDLLFLKDNQKNEISLKKMKVSISEQLDEILDVKIVSNSELLFLFDNSIKKIGEFSENIINSNFENSNKQLKMNSYNLLKSLKLKIDKNKLLLQKSEIFLELVENKILKSEIEGFIIDFQKYKNLSNGIRRDKFHESILKMFKNIIEKTIDLYNIFSDGK
jgi:hypothetical protein